MRFMKTVFLAALVGACAPMESGDEPSDGDENVGEASDALLDPGPLIKWLLYAQPGSAKIATHDWVDGEVTVVQTHSAASQFRPVSVSGNKLMWQSTTSGVIALWTLDANGAWLRTNTLTPPAGYRAASLVLSDDGACDPEPLVDRRYVLTLEGPIHPLTGKKPPPLLWLVDDAGVVLDTMSLPHSVGTLSAVHEFRLANRDEWALVEKAPTLMSDTSITIYRKHAGT
jgi:hypothetical protein